MTALVVSRLALPLLCSRGVPSARPEGLGATVAGSVSRTGLLAAVALAAVGAGLGWVAWAVLSTAEVLDAGSPGVVRNVLLVVVPLLAAGLLGRRCVRRLGGVTGDVLGAGVEVAFTAALLVAAL